MIGLKTLLVLASCAITSMIFSMGFFAPKDSLHLFMLLSGFVLGTAFMGTMMYGYGELKDEATARSFAHLIRKTFEQIQKESKSKKGSFVPAATPLSEEEERQSLIRDGVLDEDGYVTEEYMQKDPNWWQKYSRRPE